MTLKHRGRAPYLAGAYAAKPEADRIARARERIEPDMKNGKQNQERRRGERDGLRKLTSKRQAKAQRQAKRSDARRPEMRR
jgi:hypothetical protein